MKAILVTGGAGYIGSHMCKCLAHNGYEPVTLDNLCTGHESAVRWGPFYRGSIADTDLVQQILSSHNIQAVMHFAAHSLVPESIADPLKYYRNNVSGTLNLLQVLIQQKVLRFIFSSTAAIFGEPVQTPLDENHPKNPVNPYGHSKLWIEQILKDLQTAHNVNSISLRYFNAAGADADLELGEAHNPETHLIPLVLKAALDGKDSLKIHGDDYPTKDGTCIRDYIHVTDLAQAHLKALERLMNNKPGGEYNLGNGQGFSVKEVIETARRITSHPIPADIVGRRAGDPAVLISSNEKAKRDLHWTPQYTSLEEMITSAFNWYSKAGM
ncbi:MAG: UDP-glucose 4-epimerase GalE [Deltaproteobacteria bacterium]|nr:UDP-glucose 4-epimerase GalE [Deltaproteobacteria bacterium]